MEYTLLDWRRDFLKGQLLQLTPRELREVLRELPSEALLAVVPPEQIRRYLERKASTVKAKPRKPGRTGRRGGAPDAL
jgi:hypothetical protein